MERVIDDGPYRLASSLDGSMAVAASASGCSITSGPASLSFERDAATGLYRISSRSAAVLADADGSASQLWRVSACEGGWSISSASGLALDLRSRGTWEGNEV